MAMPRQRNLSARAAQLLWLSQIEQAESEGELVSGSVTTWKTSLAHRTKVEAPRSVSVMVQCRVCANCQVSKVCQQQPLACLLARGADAPVRFSCDYCGVEQSTLLVLGVGSARELEAAVLSLNLAFAVQICTRGTAALDQRKQCALDDWTVPGSSGPASPGTPTTVLHLDLTRNDAPLPTHISGWGRSSQALSRERLVRRGPRRKPRQLATTPLGPTTPESRTASPLRTVESFPTRQHDSCKVHVSSARKLLEL